MATDSEDERGSSDESSVVSEGEDTGSSDGESDESGPDESSQASDFHADDDDDESSSRSSTTTSRSESREQDDNLPVGLKLQRQREAGVDMRDSRKRKARAKEVVSERLSTLKAATTQERRRKDGEAKSAPAKDKQAKKRSKHAPTEVSSKRSDFFQRQRMSNVNEAGLGVTLAAGYKPKDPRLSSLTGHYDADKFERNYAFLNEIRDKEMVRLRQRVQAHQTTGSKGRHLRRRLGMTGNSLTTLDEDRAELKRLEQDKADRERQQIDRAARQAVKKRMHEEVEHGKRPHFVSRAKQKQLVLEAKYDELRKRKGEKAVEKAIAKRFKKDKSKLLLPREHA